LIDSHHPTLIISLYSCGDDAHNNSRFVVNSEVSIHKPKNRATKQVPKKRPPAIRRTPHLRAHSTKELALHANWLVTPHFQSERIRGRESGGGFLRWWRATAVGI
jgi:hypothetical protein